MLHNFLITNRQELLERCRAKVTARRAPRPTEAELEHGIPLFLQQLIDMLQAHLATSPTSMLSTATRHGDELLRKGFSVAQVIHDYGDLCQAITELADETDAPITAKEFGVLNLCLDDAIASAVTEYELQREQGIAVDNTHDAKVRLASFAHEMRNLLGTATLSFQMIKSGRVAIDGTTSALHDRALRGLQSLIEHTLAEARLAAGVNKERIHLGQFIEDVEQAASLEADSHALRLKVLPVDPSLAVDADRPILAAVLTNLLQNAFKFTRANGRTDVSLRVHQAADRVFIDVEDECGGLQSEMPVELFRPFEQRNADRSGLGLGLTICKRGVEANDGMLHVRNLPGHGCVFTVELARMPALAD